MKIKIALLLIAVSGGAQAATINVNNLGSTVEYVLNEAGTIYPIGSGYIGVGNFSINDATISTTSSVGDLDTAFTQYGAASGKFGSGFAFDGFFQFNTTQSNPGTFTGGMYIVIGNGATLPASTEVLVFKTASPFVSEPTPGTSALLNSGEGGSLLLGGYNNFSSGGQPAYNTVALAAIPEPSVALLGLAGGLLMLRRRRG